MPFSAFRQWLAALARSGSEGKAILEPPARPPIEPAFSQLQPLGLEGAQDPETATLGLRVGGRRTVALTRPGTLARKGGSQRLSARPSRWSSRSVLHLPGWVRERRELDATGDRIRHYELGRMLGQGGMGQVFLAYDTHLGREAAVKVVLGQDAELVQRSLREARAQARVDHPNICRVFETGEWEGQAYIAMQYIHGQTLDAAGPAMSLEDKVRIMLQVSEALHVAHCLGMVHRDMKPANVMVEQIEGQRPKPYVMDFGLVRDSSEPALTVSGMVMGTPAYMSPEQARGDQRNIDRRSDVYSLGATFYALLSGRHPYSGGDFDILVKVIQEDPVPLRVLVPDLPLALDTLVTRAMEKDQARRFATAQELADELQRFLDGSRIQSTRPGPWLRLLKWTRKNRVLAALLGSGLLALLVGTSYALFASYRSSRVAEYSRTFGILAERVELLMQAAYLRPAHPIEVERAVALKKMAEIQAQAIAKGRWAKGPGNYAIGRAYLTLGDLGKARTHLELARASGLRGADLDLAQGLVLAKQFQQELQAVSGQERQKLADQLDASLRRPALGYLSQANLALTEGTHYAQGLMAFIEGKHGEALGRLATAKKDSPWPFEALCLEANVHLTVARQAYDGGDEPSAGRHLEAMKGSLDEARRLAPSSPEVLTLWAHYFKWKLNLEPLESRAIPAHHQSGLQAADAAIALDPQHAAAFQIRGELDLRLYNSVNGLKIRQIEGLLSGAQASLSRAIALGGRDHPKVLLASVLFEKAMVLGLGLGREGQAQLMNEGKILCEEVLRENPRHELARYWFGQLLILEGNLARDGKGGGHAAYGKAMEQFQQLVDNNPTKDAFRLSLGAAALELGQAAAGAGKPPEKAIRQAIKELRWGREHNQAETSYAANLVEAYQALLEWQVGHGGVQTKDVADLVAILQWAELPQAARDGGRKTLARLKSGKSNATLIPGRP